MQTLAILLAACTAVASGLTPTQPAHRSAALIGHKALRAGGAHRAGARDLQDESDLLQGLLDGTNDAWGTLSAVFQSMESVCQSNTNGIFLRTKEQDGMINRLNSERSTQMQTAGTNQAELTHYERGEEEARGSYESTVAQRASAVVAFGAFLHSTQGEKKAMEGVLEVMKQKAATIKAANEASGPSNTGGGYQAGGMNTIMGIFGSMLDTANSDLDGETKSFEQMDEELLKLVTSHKEQLQLLDSQYEEKNQAATGAQAKAMVLSEEVSIRGMIAKSQEDLTSYLRELCGTAGSKGSKVSAALGRGAMDIENLRRQVAQAMTTMDQVDAIEATTTVLTTAAPVFLQEAAAPQLSAVSVHAAGASESNRTSDTSAGPLGAWPRWRGAAGGKAPQAAAPAAPHRTPRSEAPGFDAGAKLRVLAESLAAQEAGLPKDVQILFAAEKSRVEKAAVQSGAVDATKELKEKMDTCVDQKTTLTGQIISARREARIQRTVRITAEQRLASVQAVTKAVTDERTLMSGELQQLMNEWQVLTNMKESGEFANKINDMIVQADKVAADVKAHIDAGASPLASGLPVAVQGVKDTLVSLRDNTGGDINTISGEQSTMQVKLSTIINALTEQEDALNTKAAESQAAESTAAQEVQKQESLETQLMGDRSTVEADCETKMSVSSIDATVQGGR